MWQQLPVVFGSWQTPDILGGGPPGAKSQCGVGGPDPEGAWNRGQGKLPGLTRGEQIRAKFPPY
jgi:hypothetical protein